MSERHVSKLNERCVREVFDPDTEPQGYVTVLEAFERMRDAGYPIESINTKYDNTTLKEDGNDTHRVLEIETLTYPLGHEMCDAVDRTSLWVCSCPGWLHHHNEGFPKDVRPSEVSECPHVELCKQKERQETND